MGKSIFLIMQVFGIVSAWLEKAMQDGRITILEAVELVTQLALLIGVPTDIDTSALLGSDTKNPGPEALKLKSPDTPPPVIKPEE